MCSFFKYTIADIVYWGILLKKLYNRISHVNSRKHKSCIKNNVERFHYFVNLHKKAHKNYS